MLYGNNFQDGFETDRGRVYLKYGAPSTHVVRENSPSEYPYEIWTYNKIGKYSNKRFVFYNPDLTNGAYRLLHSDVLGELKMLHGRRFYLNEIQIMAILTTLINSTRNRGVLIVVICSDNIKYNESNCYCYS